MPHDLTLKMCKGPNLRVDYGDKIKNGDTKSWFLK